MAPQYKPLCPYERYQNSVPNPGLKASRASTRTQFHKDKLQIEFPGQNVGLNLQMTPTTTAAAAATRRQFSYLVRPLAHSAQGCNVPFGNPSLRSTWVGSLKPLKQYVYVTVLSHTGRSVILRLPIHCSWTLRFTRWFIPPHRLLRLSSTSRRSTLCLLYTSPSPRDS